jgi:hypothetical protein
MSTFTEENRFRALHRALKMNKLFNKGTFDDIMNAVYKGSFNDFEKACKKAPANLADEEIAWLWNYLKHCLDEQHKDDEGGWGPVKDEPAAQTGW